MIESNETGSILFRDFPMENQQSGGDAVGEAAPIRPSISSPYEYAHEGSSAGLWAALVALAVALAALAGYDYWFVRKNAISLGQIPSVVSSISGLGSLVDSVEAQLQSWTSDRQSLLTQMNRVEGQVRTGLSGIRKQTRAMIASAETRMDQKLDQRTQPIEAQLSQLQTNQQNQEARVAQLGNDVSSLRQQVAAAAARPENTQSLGALEQKQNPIQTELSYNSEPLRPQKVNFGLQKGHIDEIAPGISLRVIKTNVKYQRYGGWIRYQPDGLTLWIRDQGAGQPVTFYSKQGATPFEVIVTRVSNHWADGYVLLSPAAAGESQNPTTSQANPGESPR